MEEKIPEAQLRDYLTGKMAPAERDAFEQRISEDAALREELSLARLEMAAAEALVAEDMRRRFRDWKNRETGKRSQRHRRLLLLTLLAICACLLTLWILRRPQNPVPQTPSAPTGTQPPPAFRQPPETAPAPAREPAVQTRPQAVRKDYPAIAARFQEDPVLTNLRGLSGDTTRNRLRQARDAYANGDYPGTLELLRQVDAAQAQSADFLSAHALFRLGRYEEAAAAFERLVAGSRQYRYAAEWGRLLCLVAVLPNQEQAVQTFLNAILSDPDHPYFEQAGALRKAL